MTGETDLATLLGSTRPTLRPEVFVFATLKPGEEPPRSLAPIMTFREEEGMTLILLEPRRAPSASLAPSPLE